MNTKQNQEEFIRLYKENITRKGSEELLAYLQGSDFFVAPASTRFHSSEEGGLCKHSLNAYYRFARNVKNEYGDKWQDKISAESLAIIGLLHDVCKVYFYKTDYRNVKEEGIWVQKPYYTVEDALPYGHGEKSVYIISGFMKLTREEAMAINWHMGGFDPRIKNGNVSMADVYYNYPLSFIFHTSDDQATYLDEKNKE